MKKLFVTVTGCLLLFVAFAQKDTVVKNSYKQQLRLQPLALFDPFESSVRLGADVMLKPRLAVGADVSVYFAADGYTKPLAGFAIAPFARWYMNNRHSAFFEAGAMYKHTERKEEAWLGMDCVNGVPAYEKFDTYKRVKDVVDLSFRIGMRESLFGSPNWNFEMFIGLGARYKMFSIKHREANSCLQPDGIDAIGFFGNNVNSDNYAFFSVPMGIRFTRKLK